MGGRGHQCFHVRDDCSVQYGCGLRTESYTPSEPGSRSRPHPCHCFWCHTYLQLPPKCHPFELTHPAKIDGCALPCVPVTLDTGRQEGGQRSRNLPLHGPNTGRQGWRMKGREQQWPQGRGSPGHPWVGHRLWRTGFREAER